MLASTLKPGGDVVMEKLRVHRSAALLDAIHRICIEFRFLPPYSPDFNLIEMAFSRLTASLKRRAARAPSQSPGRPSAKQQTTSPRPSAKTTLRCCKVRPCVIG